jgi:hypothetical protein
LLDPKSETPPPIGQVRLIFGDISGLLVKFPDKKTGNLAKASRPAETPIRVVFSADQVNSWLPMEHVIEGGAGI